MAAEQKELRGLAEASGSRTRRALSEQADRLFKLSQLHFHILKCSSGFRIESLGRLDVSGGASVLGFSVRIWQYFSGLSFVSGSSLVLCAERFFRGFLVSNSRFNFGDQGFEAGC